MLSVIVVSWNVRELLRACLTSILAHPPTNCELQIIVVDNASADGSAAMLRADFPAVRVVANTTNRGFTGGNNDGLALIGESDFVFLLNPDAEVTAGALDALLDFAAAHPDVGVVGPQLRFGDGSLQSSRRRFPTLATAVFESTWLQGVAPRRVLDRYYARDCGEATCEVDWVVGAAMLVRREAIAQAGPLDEENFFMYSEELDWCKRIRDKGWKVVYLPSAVVIHHEAQSSRQASAKRMIDFNTSKARYFAKHHGPAQALFVRAVLFGMFAYQLMFEGAKWLLGSQRALRAERVRAYAAVLRSRLK